MEARNHLFNTLSKGSTAGSEPPSGYELSDPSWHRGICGVKAPTCGVSEPPRTAKDLLQAAKATAARASAPA